MSAPRDLREAKVVTGSMMILRYCVMANVVTERGHRPDGLPGPGRRLAGLRRPGGNLDGQWQAIYCPFRPGRGRLFDKICRRTASPTGYRPGHPPTTGKIERFHQTLRRELLNDHAHFSSSPGSPGRHRYVGRDTTDRPHQALDGRLPVTPVTGSALRHLPSATSSTCGCPRSWSPARPAAPRAHRDPQPAPPPPAGTAGPSSSTGSATIREHVGGRAAVLGRPRSGRDGDPVLG